MTIPMIYQGTPFKNGQEAGIARDKERQEQYERYETIQSEGLRRDQESPVLNGSIGGNSRSRSRNARRGT